jgi:hypothetical protein
MTRNSIASLLAGAAVLIAAAPASAAALTGFTLGGNGSTLIRFDPANPGSTISIALGGAGARLDAIDFRPATGELFGYDSRLDAYFLVNPKTGKMTRVDDRAVVPAGGSADIDWNPTIDRQRTVSSSRDNIVFNPLTGATTRAIDLFYVPGDPNAATRPFVVGNAYTNSFAANLGGTTVQYVLDARTNTLATLANNLGELRTVAGLSFNGAPFTLSESAGFDIVFDAATSTNTAYVLANAGGLADLFTLDLSTGVLTSAPGSFAGSLGRLDGLSFGVVDEVPVPAAAPLFLGALVGAALWRRARRRQAPV